MTSTERLHVPIPGRAYDILIGHGLTHSIPAILAAECPADRYVIIADDTVAELHSAPLLQAVRTFASATLLTFASGETSKNRTEWARLTDRMIEEGIGRDAAVISLGGGVTGDLAGFVAATYFRGLDLVQIPTSLLAMIDSSIGGKTGVNTGLGKNLVGIFHQPKLVIVDTSYLATLTGRHLRAGMAEALKHGVIADADYFQHVVSAADQVLAGGSEAILPIITRSLEIKSAVVAEDECEAGKRAILNFGHTVGHAVEVCQEYRMLHGECVAIGMVAEARLAATLGLCASETVETIRDGIGKYDLPTHLPKLPDGTLMAAMRNDKKNRSEELRFSLPEQLGSMVRTDTGEWTIPADISVTKRLFESTS